MVLVILSLGTLPPEWGEYSHAEWKLLTPMVNSMYIKRARSYRPKTTVPDASTTTTTGTTDTNTATTAEGHFVYLQRARIVGHGSLFCGNVPELLRTLPRIEHWTIYQTREGTCGRAHSVSSRERAQTVGTHH